MGFEICNHDLLFTHQLVYEFRYQGHLFTRKCYVCEQFIDVHELMYNYFKILALKI